MKISAQKAAEILGVSRTQISRLVSAGEIRGDRFGNALQIELDSVHRYQDLRPAPGRPLPPASAWNWLADVALPKNVEELKRLAVAVRRRAERHEMRILPGSVDRLLGDPRVRISGAAAAVHHGAAVRDRPPHSVYVRASNFDQLIKQHRLSDVVSEHNIVV